MRHQVFGLINGHHHLGAFKTELESSDLLSKNMTLWIWRHFDHVNFLHNFQRLALALKLVHAYRN